MLADPAAAGATYLDLRVPERVAAGGLGPVTDEAEQGAAGTATPADPEAPADAGAAVPEDGAATPPEPLAPDPQP